MFNQSITLISRDTGESICNTENAKPHYFSLTKWGEPGENIWIDNGRVGYNFEYADIDEVYYRIHPDERRPSPYRTRKVYSESTSSGVKILTVSKKHRTAVDIFIDFESGQANFINIFRGKNADFDFSLTFAEIDILHRLIQWFIYSDGLNKGPVRVPVQNNYWEAINIPLDKRTSRKRDLSIICEDIQPMRVGTI